MRLFKGQETLVNAKRTRSIWTCLLVALLITQLCKADLYDQALINRQQFVNQSSNFTVTNIDYQYQTVDRYEKIELTFNVDAPWTNPFDPNDIKVVGILEFPDQGGLRKSVPAFYCIPYEPANGTTQLQGDVTYTQTGSPCWKIRYACATSGNLKIQIMLHKPSTNQYYFSSWMNYYIRNADHNSGYIQKASGNPQYFEHSSDNSLFYGCGPNLPWTRWDERVPDGPSPTMEDYMSKVDGNISSTRIWMCHYAWLEWMPVLGKPANNSWNAYAGVNYYNQMIAAAFDNVFEMAEAQDLKVMLTLDDNNELMTGTTPDQWNYNPNNTINGGSCSTPADYWTSSTVRQQYKNRLRYIYARWGYSASLWALNTWNDMGASAPSTDVQSWHQEMRDYLHSLSDEHRPIFYGTNHKYAVQTISDYAQAEPVTLQTDKPNVLQECYYTSNEAWFEQTMIQQLWGNFAKGQASVMIWPHFIIDKLDLWSPVFAKLVDFAETINLNTKTFVTTNVPVASVNTSGAGTMTCVVSVSPYGDVPEWGMKATQDVFDIDTNQTNLFLEGYIHTLYGTSRSAWRTTPTFNINLPAAGEIVLNVGEVSGSLHLDVYNNNVLIHSEAYSGSGRYNPDPSQEYIHVSLPAGNNSVRVEVTGSGSDWLRLKHLYFAWQTTQGKDMVNVTARIASDEAFAYVQNLTYNEAYVTEFGGSSWIFYSVHMTMSGFMTGTYTIEIVDVLTGNTVETRSATTWGGGKISFYLQTLPADRALRIKKNP